MRPKNVYPTRRLAAWLQWEIHLVLKVRCLVITLLLTATQPPNDGSRFINQATATTRQCRWNKTVGKRHKYTRAVIPIAHKFHLTAHHTQNTHRNAGAREIKQKTQTNFYGEYFIMHGDVIVCAVRAIPPWPRSYVSRVFRPTFEQRQIERVY